MSSVIRLGRREIRPSVLLAPMAGVTDAPFRRQVRKFGAGLVASEMVASKELVQNRFDVRAKAALSADDGLAAVQIAGCEARWLAEAARMAEDAGAPIIDINMGCPAKKVTNGLAGSALMRDPDHALSLIDAVAAAVKVPVTLKTRLGWDENAMNAAEIAARAEAAGVALVTIHGRTRCQFYKGAANWRAIRTVRAAVSIPVVANGDIVDPNSAEKALRLSGADAVMVGRGALGRPWLLAEIAAAQEGRTFSAPTAKARIELAIEHYEGMVSHYGRELGVRCARKHLGWRLADFSGGEALRAKLVRESEPAEVIARLSAFAKDLDDAELSVEPPLQMSEAHAA